MTSACGMPDELLAMYEQMCLVRQVELGIQHRYAQDEMKTPMHMSMGEEAIVAMVNNGKTNVMPAQEKRLSPEQIHVLGAYVWNLSKSTVATAAK